MVNFLIKFWKKKFHRKIVLNKICTEEDSFKWTDKAEKSFEVMKHKVTNASILSLLDF